MSERVRRQHQPAEGSFHTDDRVAVEEWIRRSGEAIADPDPLRSRIVSNVVTRRIRVHERRRFFGSMLASAIVLIGGGFAAKHSGWGQRLGPSATTAELENHALRLSHQTGLSIDWSLVETFRSQRFRR